ncbi:MAG: (2Fe-2S)-binding protein [Cellvibrionaceae bacterium]|nr:(2Fe-2S)-binding protein [Cellvibrionaceae bacterium]
MISFTLNGQQVDADLPPDTPLLWVVREHFGLSGSKFGCGKGLCGACTLHIDGAATRSCVMPLAAVAGRAVTTIEGLAQGEQLHPVQQAWLAHNVPQCGYCQPGQIMSASALLATNAKPSDDDIDAAMSGNLCRCGTYPRIRKAIKSLAASGVQQFDPKVQEVSQ